MLKTAPMMLAFAILFSSPIGAVAQDAEAGEKVFKKCMSCHQVGPDAKHRSGPILNGVVGRPAGSAEGYKYRKDILAAAEKGLVWDQALLSEYLNDPTKFLRSYLDNPKARSAMSFKLKDETDQQNVIAFLATTTTEQPVEGDTSAAPETAAVPTINIDEIIAQQEFPEPFMNDDHNIAAGKEFWFAQCTHCHGDKAYPGKAPKLKPAKYKPDFVFKRIYKGFKKMPEWRETFTVDEIRQIVAYVKSSGFAP